VAGHGLAAVPGAWDFDGVGFELFEGFGDFFVGCQIDGFADVGGGVLLAE